MPYYLEKENIHHLPKEIDDRLFYKILKLDYSFEQGVDIPKNDEATGSYFC